jgi:hypothetical protein
MDPFVVIVVGGLVGLVVGLLLLGRLYPGSGAEQLDWRPTRSAELEAQNEIDDLEQMLEAANRRRRARGQAELTEDSVRRGVAEDTALAHRLRDEQRDRRDALDLLEETNRRRRARGEAELTLDEL